MTRLNRVISIVSVAVAFVVLFLLASIVSHLGPVEFIVVIALAIPLGMVIVRAVRSVLRAPSASA